MIFMRIKKVISIILCLTTLFSFSACSSKSNTSNNNSDNLLVKDNLIYYDNVNYRVNTVLDSSNDIEYVDFEESNRMTSVEFGWNSFSNDDGEGCKDILIMYYDDSLINVQSGKQPILGSVYCHTNDDMSREWSYFGAEHNLIYKTNSYQIYDKNNNLIGYIADDGRFYDEENNPLDISSFDPFIDVLDTFEG